MWKSLLLIEREREGLTEEEGVVSIRFGCGHSDSGIHELIRSGSNEPIEVRVLSLSLSLCVSSLSLSVERERERERECGQH